MRCRQDDAVTGELAACYDLLHARARHRRAGPRRRGDRRAARARRVVGARRRPRRRRRLAAEQARALVERAAEELGGLDLLVNAAGEGFAPKPLEELDGGGLGRRLRRDGEGQLLRHPGRSAAPACVARLRGDDRGRRRLPAVAVVRRALGGEGGAGDAHARARARARARGTRLRRRPGPRRGRARPGGAARRRDSCSGASARPRTSPTPSSTSPAPTSSPARRCSSTAAARCKSGVAPRGRRTMRWSSS